MTQSTQKIAVITGDLVNSTELGSEKVERAFAALKDCAKVQADWHGAPLKFTRHRGDGWQVALARPEMALRSALAFRAALRAEGREFDSYMGIAEGETSGVLKENLNVETNAVFSLSGKTLEMAKENKRYRIRPSHGSDPGKDAATYLAGYISDGWTPAQAAAILPFLAPSEHPTFTEVAKGLGKSRQAVVKSLEAAALFPLDLALNRMEGKVDD